MLAALELLADQGRARVVPALLLHHPSRPVVLRTLALLDRDAAASTGSRSRTDCWRARTPRSGPLRCAHGRPCNPTSRCCAGLRRIASPLVRATAFVGLIGSGCGPRGDLERASGAGGLAFAGDPRGAGRGDRAAAGAGIRGTAPPARPARATSGWPRTWRAPWRRSAARPSWPTLIGWLERSRGAGGGAGSAARARRGSAARPGRGARRLRAPRRGVREHIPRTISLFPPEPAVAVLQRHLAVERDGRVRFKILRGLGRIATDHPEVALDDALVREVGGAHRCRGGRGAPLQGRPREGRRAGAGQGDARAPAARDPAPRQGEPPASRGSSGCSSCASGRRTFGPSIVACGTPTAACERPAVSCSRTCSTSRCGGP